MSLVIGYRDNEKMIAHSDDAVVGVNAQKRVPFRLPGRASKMSILPCNAIFATVGRGSLTERLLCGVPRMVAGEGYDFERTVDALPYILRRAWAHREPVQTCFIDLQVSFVAGIDRHGRIRVYALRSGNNFVPTEINNPVFAIGALDDADEKRLQDFTVSVAKLGKTKGAPWVAVKVRDFIDHLAALHPERLGRASYFAGVNRKGLIALPAEFPPPPSTYPTESSRSSTAGRVASLGLAATMALSGCSYIGSIRTPQAGGPDTIGDASGGTGAQSGMVTRHWLTVVEPRTSFVGNGTLSDLDKALNADLTDYATLQVDGSGGVSESHLFLGIPSGITRGCLSAKLNLLVEVPTNSLSPAGGSVVEVFYGTSVHDDVTGEVVATAPIATLLQIFPTTTASKQMLTADLPPDVDFSQFVVRFDVVSNGSLTGSAIMRILGGWIETVE